MRLYDFSCVISLFVSRLLLIRYQAALYHLNILLMIFLHVAAAAEEDDDEEEEESNRVNLKQQ